MEDESVSTKQIFAATNLRAYWEEMVRQLDAIAGKNGLQDPMAAQLRDEYEASLRRIADPVFVSKSLSNSQLMGDFNSVVAESWPSAEEILADRKAFMVHFDNMRHSGGLRTLHILDVTIEDCLFW
ncbi:hypothetical protein PILCRDRAFT_820644 [Piloderma croceum F 1598]|uniref:Uncharacterized protein n=1 Tax=Piloderma croceum (strain F 1598) TaxID=765440 RepID=A0A0C3FTT4_PILCF|nr:hypothetical protein PILCRDRAFT_820644 [Piloderma croceum F 1598]